MIQNPMDVLKLFPIRKSKQQKEAFADAVIEYAQEQGYTACVEEKKKDVRNIVIGDLSSAKYMITAHYDTPASIGLPNFIVPNNPVLFVGIQLLLVAFLVAFAVAVGFLAYWICENDSISYLVGYFAYLILFLLMIKGPANRNNANDNTSGIVTLLEILSALPNDLRDSVCFVLFDMEEGGLIGSSIFRKTHKSVTENLVVLNLDCVGDGDIIQLTPVKKARKNPELLTTLAKVCGRVGNKELRLREKGFYGGSSDHKNFPLGVAIMSFHYKKGIGLYCGRIHTWRDTVLDKTNVDVLRDALISLIADHKK